MVYRDIIEYAREHLDSDCQSKEEARLAIRIHLKSIGEKGGNMSLYSRGDKRHSYYRGAWNAPSIVGVDPEKWSAAFRAIKKDRPGLFKAVLRRAAIERKLEAKALMAMEDFGYIDIPTAEAIADAALTRCEHVVMNRVQKSYPFEGSVSRVNVSCDLEFPHTVQAHYERGTVAITVAARSLMDEWLPLPRVFKDHRKAIVLDAVEVKDGLVYAQWAVQAKRSRQLVVMRGAFCDNEFVAGYDTEAEVLENEEAIHTQARVQTVTRGLIGDYDKPRVLEKG